MQQLYNLWSLLLWMLNSETSLRQVWHKNQQDTVLHTSASTLVSLKSINFCNRAVVCSIKMMTKRHKIHVNIYTNAARRASHLTCRRFIELDNSTEMLPHLLQWTQRCLGGTWVKVAQLRDIFKGNGLQINHTAVWQQLGQIWHTVGVS